MLDNLARSEDRRRHTRTEVVATALVFSTDCLHGSYLVSDVSAGGALLQGSVGAGRGTPVTVMLQFPGKTAFSVNAKVARQDKRSHAARTAIVFVDLSAEEEDAIHEAIVGALERENARQAASVLVLDADASAREAMERELRAVGHQIVAVATPLEALAWIERPGAQITTVVVDLSPGPTQGLDVLEFVSTHYPKIQRIVMADAFRLDLALRSGRAHKALRKPWDPTILTQTLGLQPRPTAVSDDGDADVTGGSTDDGDVGGGDDDDGDSHDG